MLRRSERGKSVVLRLGRARGSLLMDRLWAHSLAVPWCLSMEEMQICFDFDTCCAGQRVELGVATKLVVVHCSGQRPAERTKDVAVAVAVAVAAAAAADGALAADTMSCSQASRLLGSSAALHR